MAHPAHSKKLDSIDSKGQLVSQGEIEKSFVVDALTKDIRFALRFSNYVVIALPSFAQEGLFTLMKPHISNAHNVIFLNGNFGALSFLQHLDGQRPTLFETNVAPHASRVTEDGVVRILGTKNFMPIAAFPASTNSEIKKAVNHILPCHLEWCDNLLEVGMQSNNGVIHPAPAVLNAGWIESKKGDFLFLSRWHFAVGWVRGRCNRR